MKRLKFLFYSSYVFFALSVPTFASAIQLVNCEKNCGWNEFFALINTVIHFTLFYMALPIAAIMFAYAGVLLVIAGEESSSAKTKAKEIFTNAVIGLLIVLAAYLIIKTILSILGYEGAWIGF